MSNSATVGLLRVLLTADTAQYEKALQGADKDAKRLANTMERDLAPSQAKVNSLVKSFLGSKEIGLAKNYATAIQEIGGAANLTATHQARANKAFNDALAHLKALGIETGKDVEQFKAMAAATQKVQAPTQKLNSDIAELVGSLKAIGGTLGVTLGLSAVVATIKNLVTEGNKLEGVRNSFNRLTTGLRLDGDDLIKSMRDNTRGLVGQVDLFQSANKAMLLGLPVTVESMGEMSKAATRLGKAMGLDATTALDNLITALGRVSPLILDNLGLTVKVEEANEKYARSLGKSTDALTEADRKMAFYNEAMEKAKEKSEQLGEVAPTLSESFDSAWVAIKDGAVSTMAWLNKTLGEGVLQLSERLNFLFSLGTGGWNGPGKTPTDAEYERKMKEAWSTAPTIKSPFAMMVPTIGSATDALNAFNREHGDAIKQIEKHITAVDRLEEKYQSFRRERMTGLSDSERERREFEARYMRELGLTGAAAWAQSIVRRTDMSALGSVPLGYTPPGVPIPSMALPMKTQAQGPISLAQLLSGVVIPPHNMGDLMRAGFGGAFGQLPQTILSAITGGGNIGQSIASLFGSQVGGSLIGTSANGIFSSGLGKSLQGVFGNKVGGMIANFIPGVGALLGPALGKLFGAIGGIGANTTKGSREDFAKQLGFESLGNLYAKLKSLGAEGDKLANIGLNIIGKKDKAANEKWMKDVTAFFDRLEKVPGKVQELSQALERFGGAIPDSVSPLLDSILGNSALSPELRRQLEGMRKPSWQAAQEMAEALGINPAALGRGFNQSRLADSAFKLKRALDVFGKFQGSDQNAILRDMADEFSELARESIKTGAAIPKAVESFIRQIASMGLLLDENGNQIEMSLLSFAEIEDEYEKQVVSLLEQIRNLLDPSYKAPGTTPPAPPRVPGTPPAVPTPPSPVPYDPGDGFMPMPTLPSFGAQYAGWSDADMSGLSGGGDTYNINAIDTRSFEQFLRDGANRAVLRTLPEAYRRAAIT